MLSLAMLALTTGSAAQEGQAVPSFTKTFAPDTIGPGSTSTLRFDIVNQDSVPVTDLAFTDVLPAGVAIASPSGAVSGCGGILTAPDGGGTITFAGGDVGALSQCSITVNVSSAVVGTHMNVSGDLTSSAGNSGPAADDLVVVSDRPGFSKSFTPATIPYGGRSRLTFTIDNTANAATVFNLQFSDTLPAGLTVADPALAATTCIGGVITADPGSDLISYAPQGFNDASVLAGATCTIAVDVTADAVGTLVNISDELTSSFIGPTVSSGRATAALDVTAGTVYVAKRFVEDPVGPGGTVTLEFTIGNNDRTFAATGIAFTDDLDATLGGLTAVGLPAVDVCGPGSTISGTAVLSLAGGSVAPADSCTFSVTLQVPSGAAPGSYPNTTGAITADLGGVPFIGGPGADSLVISTAPLLQKTFLTNPVGAGDSVAMEFTITNASATDPVTDVGFTDDLGAFLSGATVAALPPAGFCGPGSNIFLTYILGSPVLGMGGGDLAAGASCTFAVDLQLPVGGAAGGYTNITSPIAGVVGGLPQLGAAASDTLTVVTAPRVSKSFTDDPVAPGGTTTLEFTIDHDPAAPGDATAIGLSDDLAAVLPGLSAVGLPAADVCGAGSTLSGTTNLVLSGGTLSPGGSCTFSVPLQVPVSALPGDYQNVTSNLTATVAGVVAVGPGAQDTLNVSGLSLTKEFIDDPVIPGGTVTLRFSIDNSSPSTDASAMSFSDNLSSVVSGLTATNLPLFDICGAGSAISGTSNLTFSGGTLPAGSSCTFDVTLAVPAAAASNTYGNTTSSLLATVGGAVAALPPAFDQLVVDDDLLQLTKAFTDDPVAPGGLATLEFTVTNLDPVEAASAIAFTDDLDAALSGLTAVGLPAADVCGAGSLITGGGLLTFTGGSLAAGGTCTFTVPVQVPASVPLGTTAVNTTGAVTGIIAGLGVTGAPATDTLLIDSVELGKSFDTATSAGGTAVLTLTINNLDAGNGVSGISLTDDLDAVLPGLTAVGLPLADVCGAGSQISGTSFLTLTNGSLFPAGSCTIDVTVAVPSAAAPGSYTNVTSELFAAGIRVAAPATADLVVEPPPLFAKTFTPAVIFPAGVSTLDLIIDNSASSIAADSLDVTDTLPAGVTVATPANAATTCTGGTLTAAPGSGTIAFTGGSVAAGSSCTISVDVTAVGVGSAVNVTGDLTSSLGNSGTATATLTVDPVPLFSKAFSPALIQLGGTSTLTFTIDNTGSSLAVGAIDFTDNLPAGVAVASPSNASSTCSGGAITAVPGTSTIAYTGGGLAAGAACTLVVDVTGVTAGLWTNTTGDLTSTAGSSGPATAPIEVVEGDFVLSKSFLAAPVLRGGLVDLEFTITNLSTASSLAAIGFTDDLGAVVPGLAATGLPAADICGPGSTLSGTTTLSLSGGSLAPSSSCSFTVTVTVPADAPLGVFTNTTGQVTATAGGIPVTAPPASADFEIGFFAFAKTFLAAGVPGDLVDLEFTIANPDTVNTATGIGFTDDLDAVLPGLAAVGLPVADVCGPGSVIDGTSLLTLTGGSLAPGGTCTFTVTVQIPFASTAGSYTNQTSVLTATVAGATVAGDAGSEATGDLEVTQPPDAIPALDRAGLLLLASLLAIAGAALLRVRS